MSLTGGQLARLRSAREVEIATRAAPQAALHRTIIWVVVDDRDRVLVRSVRGARGRWYREALAHADVDLIVDGAWLPFRAALADDEERVTATSAALAAKYARNGSLRSMLAPHTLPTTLELVPR